MADLIADPAGCLLSGGGLGLAFVRARTRDDRHGPVDHHRVLHERRIRAVWGGVDLDGLPAGGVQRVHVRLPLLLGQLKVDRLSFDVGDQSFRQSGRRTPDEGLLGFHGQPFCPTRGTASSTHRGGAGTQAAIVHFETG